MTTVLLMTVFTIVITKTALGRAQRACEQDLVMAFDDISGVDKSWLNSFYPALMANGNIEGKTWGIPFQRSTIVAYYNKDLFRSAGLDPEAPPTTWDEIISMG